MAELKCVLSTEIPSEWAPYLASGDESGLSEKDMADLLGFISENNLFFIDCFDFGHESNGRIRVAAFSDSPVLEEVPQYKDMWDCLDWAERLCESSHPSEFSGLLEAADYMLERASELDKPTVLGLIEYLKD